MIDSDEEARSPAHHCEFRQAEVVLPHLPFYHSPSLNPLFYSPFPNTSDRGWRGWWKTCLLRLSPFNYFFFLSFRFPPHSRLLSFSILHLLLFPHRLPPFLFPCLSHIISPSCLAFSPPSTSALLAPNSCCCARMRLNLTQVWMAKKKQFSAHLPHSFFLFFPSFFKWILEWFRSTSDYLSTYLTKTQKHVLMGTAAENIRHKPLTETRSQMQNVSHK